MSPEQKAACKAHSATGSAGISLEEYRNSQRHYNRALNRLSESWRITDFVTVGSPLAHAPFLMVDDRGTKPFATEVDRAKGEWVGKYLGLGEDRPTAFQKITRVFAVRAHQREFAMNPPQTEPETNPCPLPDDTDARDSDTFSYKPGDGPACVPHHAALFSAVRWTNLYAPCSPLLYGDPIAGPVAPVFGPGVKDVPIDHGAGRTWVAHGRYWDTDPKHGDFHLKRLRSAVNLRDRDDAIPGPGGDGA